MNETQVRALKAGDHVWVKGWHQTDRHIGVVERTTSTQVVVIQDFSFQGGTNRSVSKFRRRNSEGREYGAGYEIGGGTMSKHLDGIPTLSQGVAYKDDCDDKHRRRMASAAFNRRQEETLANLNGMVPADCYVQHNSGLNDEGTFSITIGGLLNQAQVVKYAQEISKLVKRLSRA